MITINNLSIAFNGEELFENISFTIADKDRIGLVGKNGAGKSTLLKILCGIMQQDVGTIIKSENQTIGYLPQEIVAISNNTVLGEAMTAFGQIISLKQKLEEVNKKIVSFMDYESKEYEDLISTSQELEERLRMFDASNAEPQARKVLLGLGFVAEDFDRALNEFSSGWQMRVYLAKILLQRPNFILLDEPTNHLDIESITWLEDFLSSYYGAIVLVSHDRCFLDNVTKRTIEISAGKIYDYKVPYSEYQILHTQRIEEQKGQMAGQQRQIKEVERFIERFRYKATKAKQVQSRVKMLEKMERVEADEVDTSSIRFLFPPAPHSGKIVLDIKNLCKKYGNKTILHNVDMVLKRGDKVSFVGKNGEGKSTLVKCIVGQIKDYMGECHLGYDVKIGYFAQNGAALLDKEKTVFETIDEVAKGEARTKIRLILGSFLFSNEDIDKKVKVLSGGEKTRLALALLLLDNVNLLILDEPTNHLDMDSKDILKNALIKYDGSLIVVSHDRDFLEGLTDTLYEFHNHTIKEYHDDIVSFLERKKLHNLEELNLKDKQNVVKEKSVSDNKQQFLENKDKERERRKQKNTLQKIENQITEKENIIAEMESKIASSLQSDDFYKEYQMCKQNLNELMCQWEKESEKLEEME